MKSYKKSSLCQAGGGAGQGCAGGAMEKTHGLGQGKAEDPRRRVGWDKKAGKSTDSTNVWLVSK